ncbi:MAG: hypothetical protein O3A89_06970 [Actinomycetota bacterium]|nr:hypothetical protein [Actinomycetota bacterium]
MTSSCRRVTQFWIVGALAMVVAACGSGDETTFSTPDDTAAATETTEASASDDVVLRDEATDLEAELRASDAFNDGDFMALPTERQECVISAVAARPDLAESALSDTGPDDSDGLELTKILLECAPEMVRELMSDGDETGDLMLEALSDQQLECIVDALVADPTVLSDAVEGGDGTAMGLAMLDCAPDVVAESMADELGVTVDQAACLLQEDGVLMQLMLAGDDVNDEDAFGFLEDMLTAFEDCGIDVGSMMGDSFLDPDSAEEIAEYRADCEAGDMGACDDLYYASGIGSDDEDFGATCGGTADGSTAGMCSFSPPTAEEIAQVRADCEAGDMVACDELFYASPVGSDDEDFGATCGGTADGSTAGSCGYVTATDEQLAEYRADCDAGDMDACDELYYASPFGSDDEEFGATCGGTTDGTEPGTCWLSS